MAGAQKNYFVYLPDHQEPPPWECVTDSVGFSRVIPGSVYPPQRHPMDHHFNWADGRILHSYSIVYISEGRGVFESAVSPRKHRIEAGTVFLLFPEIWHRYAPDPDTGWVEHWIECHGPAFDRALAAGIIRPGKAVLHVGADPGIIHCFERCHLWAHQIRPGRQAVLSTLALHMLALLAEVRASRESPLQRIDEIIQRAQLLISGRCQENIRMQKLAKELNVGYSHFRQAFKEQTGISPKQFHTRARLQKAREFLANTSKSVKEIAGILGFHSAFHLSKQFKTSELVAPRIWRDHLHRRTGRRGDPSQKPVAKGQKKPTVLQRKG